MKIDQAPATSCRNFLTCLAVPDPLTQIRAFIADNRPPRQPLDPRYRRSLWLRSQINPDRQHPDHARPNPAQTRAICLSCTPAATTQPTRRPASSLSKD
jgi:hypothetical protein